MVETLEVEGKAEICRVVVEIPNLKGEPTTSKKRILLAVDENQLWNIFIGLNRLRLIPILQEPTKEMADEIHKLGEKVYGWVKV